MKKIKICLAASSGGHLTELMKLSDIWQNQEIFYITTVTSVQDYLGKSGNVYIVGECNRNNLLRVARVFLTCLKIVLREKPNVIISTGAAAGCISCFFGKMFGAKIIWLDSIANVERLSLSGRMVRHIADLFLVQWPELTKKYKNVEFAGSVI